MKEAEILDKYEQKYNQDSDNINIKYDCAERAIPDKFENALFARKFNFQQTINYDDDHYYTKIILYKDSKITNLEFSDHVNNKLTVLFVELLYL